MKNTVLFRNYFSKAEIGLWTGSVLLIIVSFLLFDKENYLTLTASLIGVTSLIFNAKGNPFGQLLMVIFSLLYGVISYSFAYFGEMITYLGMTMPMAVFSLISWLKNPYKGNKAEVKIERMEKVETLIMWVLTGVVTVVFYSILQYFHTANIVPSTLSVATSFLAVYLTFWRNPYFAIAYATNDMVLILLWILASMEDARYVSVVICFMAFLVNDIYGYMNWKRREHIGLKKIRKIVFALLIAIAVVFQAPMTARAADAEFRMMHGEQDAIVVGTIKEITEEGCLIEKSHVIMCKAENTLNRQLPAEEIPDELLIEQVKYRFSYHKKSYPEVGDCIVISVNKKGKGWQQEWMAFEVSSTDISALEVMMQEDMTSDAYAWQVFIRSDGEKVNFAYDGEILYLDNEKIFDKAEHLKTLSEAVSEEEYNIEDFQVSDSSVSVAIIGGADGPTSIFLAGKLGTGFKVMTALIVIAIVVLISVIVWKIKKK